MRIAILSAVTAIGGLISQPISAAEKAWHQGTITAVERQERTTAVKHSDTEYSQDGKGKVKAETKTTNDDVPVEVYMIFTITDGQRTYVVRQGSTVWHSKIKAQSGDKVEFAVEGDTLYVHREDNKEVKLKIIKSSLASSPSETH